MDGGSVRPTTIRHERIWVRRGICHLCNRTFTVLADWLVPSAPFTLRCRQQACESIAAGVSVEQAAPHCKDPSRSPDPSTLRRWAHRRLLSMCCWVKAGAIGQRFLRAVMKLLGHSSPDISGELRARPNPPDGTQCECLQLRPPTRPPCPGAVADSSNVHQFGSGPLGNCGNTQCLLLCVPAELCRASKASKGRPCCSKAIGTPFPRHNPELGIRPVKRVIRPELSMALRHRRLILRDQGGSNLRSEIRRWHRPPISGCATNRVLGLQSARRVYCSVGYSWR
jgi:hypothetical protein